MKRQNGRKIKKAKKVSEKEMKIREEYERTKFVVSAVKFILSDGFADKMLE